jgi:predicted SprT family Zn-dependent metalloprotease
MSLDEFMGVAPKKKSTQKKEHPFKDDPKEIRPSLLEVFKCTTKSELESLAKKYAISGISALNKDDLRDLLYKEIRNGAVKQISEYEKKGYIVAEYRCSCKYTIKTNIPKGRDTKTRYCKKCGKEMKLKIIT